MTVTQYVIVGRIRKAQGIRGHVTVELLTDSQDLLFAPGRRLFAGTTDGDIARHPADRDNPESRQELIVEEANPFKGGLIVKFDAIADRTSADLWRHRYLLVPMDELPPLQDDDVFIHELVGMTVRGGSGGVLGEVIGTYELPQGLMLEVKTERGDVLVPYRPAIVLEVDRDGRSLTVDADSGLFE